MLLTVKFLDSVYHGEKTTGVSEWPPSPYRLFQAMLAGVYTRKLLSEERAHAVLRWLESQEPPTICAVDTFQGSTLTMAGRLNQVPAKNCLRAISQLELQEPLIVQYQWKADPGALRGDLAALAAGVMFLGHGIDKAFAYVSDTEPEAGLKKWVVNNRVVGNNLRVPVVGTLDDLLASYQHKAAWPQCPRAVRAYDFATYHSGKLQTHVAFKLQDMGGDPVAVDPHLTSVVAAWVRHAALERAKVGFPGDVESYVAGHCRGEETQERFAYLPLPSVGHHHSDGYIRRVVVAADQGDDGVMTRWAADSLNGAVLTDEDGEFRAVMVRDDLGDGVLNCYTKPFRVWRSVTPVILPWRGRFDQVKTEEIFRHLIFPHAGLDVRSFTLSPSAWQRSLPNRYDYDLPDYLRDKQSWHLEAELRERVSGPVMLGAGRFRGLGVMAGVA